MLKLGTIEEEAALCREANKDVKIGDLVLHLHHEVGCEPLIEPIENRISFILKNKDRAEQALRLRLMRVVRAETLRRLLPDAEWKKADAEWKKAYAEWKKADAEREKAYAEWEKADAEWEKADAEREKAYAEWKKADAEREKAYAEWKKADAEWEKADAEWEKAYAEWEKAYAELFPLIHAQLCPPGCPWNGRTIFSE